MITLLSTEAFTDPEGMARVSGEAYRHLFRARRLALGDRIRAVDGDGAARWAEVAAVDRRSARIRLGEVAPANEPDVPVGLVVAALKPQRAGWLVEKATEVGIDSIQFVASARSPRSYGPGTFERLRRLAVAAVEQCHRAKVPEIGGVHDWSEMAEMLDPWSERWLLDPAGEAVRPGAAVRPSVLVVGPEGGLEEEERAELVDLGCRALFLGRRALRVETAATIGSALPARPGSSAGPKRVVRPAVGL